VGAIFKQRSGKGAIDQKRLKTTAQNKRIAKLITKSFANPKSFIAYPCKLDH